MTGRRTVALTWCSRDVGNQECPSRLIRSEPWRTARAGEASAPARALFDESDSMQPETIGAVVARMQAIESDVADLRMRVEAEELEISDRRYLSRCFDLLGMELRALRQYLVGLD